MVAGESGVGDVDGDHLDAGFEGNIGGKHVLGADPEGFQKGLTGTLLRVYAGEVQQPPNPPFAAFLDNCSVLHGLHHNGNTQVFADFPGKLLDNLAIARHFGFERSQAEDCVPPSFAHEYGALSNSHLS